MGVYSLGSNFKDFLDIERDLSLGVVDQPTENSKYFTEDESHRYEQPILRKLSWSEYIELMGDVNAKTCNLRHYCSILEELDININDLKSNLKQYSMIFLIQGLGRQKMYQELIPPVQNL